MNDSLNGSDQLQPRDAGATPPDAGSASAFNPYAPPASSPFPPPGGGYGGDSDGIDVLADRWTRLGAALIDGLLVTTSVLPGVILWFNSGDFDSSKFENFADFMFTEKYLTGTLVALAGGLILQIFQWYLIATTGQSLAKRWLNIRIVLLDGRLPGFGRGVALRAWILGAIQQIPTFGLIVALVDALMIFGEPRRCLHDYIAGTKVVVVLPE